MSERYGTPDELQGVLEGLETWVREEIDIAVADLKRTNGLGDPRYTGGRMMALRDVLSYLRVEP